MPFGSRPTGRAAPRRASRPRRFAHPDPQAPRHPQAGPRPPRLRAPPSGAGPTIVATQLVFDGVDEGLPGGLDDVVGHADRAPGLVAIPRRDEDARLGAGALRFV